MQSRTLTVLKTHKHHPVWSSAGRKLGLPNTSQERNGTFQGVQRTEQVFWINTLNTLGDARVNDEEKNVSTCDEVRYQKRQDKLTHAG